MDFVITVKTFFVVFLESKTDCLLNTINFIINDINDNKLVDNGDDNKNK